MNIHIKKYLMFAGIGFIFPVFVFAAWVDAPNGPPNYGSGGCSPTPCEEAEFKPINQGATQTKQGGLNVMGNVGIGITSPANNFHIHEPSSSFNALQLTNIVTGTGASAGLRVLLDGAQNANIIIDGNKALRFTTNSLEHMRITGSGNVGIGTTIPSQKLEVAGSIRASAFYAGGTTYFIDPDGVSSAKLAGSIELDGSITTATGNIDGNQLCISGDCKASWAAVSPGSISGTANTIAKYDSLGTNIVDSQIFDNGLNVGIGTVSPVYALQINKADTTQTGAVYISAALNNSGKGLVIDTTTRTVGDNSVLALEVINRAGTNALAVTVEGKVGIGTASPAAPLQIGQSDMTGSPLATVEARRLSIGTNTHTGATFDIYARDDPAFAYLDFYYANQFQHIMSLRHDGNVGIGTKTPTAQLDIAQVDGKHVRISGGVISLQGNSVNNPFIEWLRDDGARQGYMGWVRDDLRLQLEGGYTFNVMGGNMGIGVQNTKGQLEIGRGNTTPSIVFNTGGTNNGADYLITTVGTGGSMDVINYIENWGGNYIWQRGSAGGPVESMRINTNLGRVGIGTNNPLEKLHVQGQILVSDISNTIAPVDTNGNWPWTTSVAYVSNSPGPGMTSNPLVWLDSSRAILGFRIRKTGTSVRYMCRVASPNKFNGLISDGVTVLDLDINGYWQINNVGSVYGSTSGFFIFDSMISGRRILAGGVQYNKPAGLNYMPPGSFIRLQGHSYDGSLGCALDVLYSS